MKIHHEITKIIFDTNALDYIKTLTPEFVYVISDSKIKELGISSPIITYFNQNNIRHKIFSDVEPDPSDKLVRNTLLPFIDAKPDLVIALGGGSTIDLTKAIIYYYVKLKNKFATLKDISKPYFIAIPTTSGSGSEVTNYAVITDTQSNKKQVLQSNFIQPDIAILHATFALSVPAAITADTGIDALTHALEAYVSKKRTPFSDAYALKAIELIFENLILSYKYIDQISSKKNMQYASTLAGLSFNHSGLGINHSIAHSLSDVFRIPHGRANALILPEVVTYNCRKSEIATRYSQIAKHLGLSFSTTEMNCKALIEAIRVLMKHLNLPRSFHALNIDMTSVVEQLPRITKNALNDFCTSSHPFIVSPEDIRGIIMSVI